MPVPGPTQMRGVFLSAGRLIRPFLSLMFSWSPMSVLACGWETQNVCYLAAKPRDRSSQHPFLAA